MSRQNVPYFLAFGDKVKQLDYEQRRLLKASLDARVALTTCLYEQNPFSSSSSALRKMSRMCSSNDDEPNQEGYLLDLIVSECGR